MRRDLLYVLLGAVLVWLWLGQRDVNTRVLTTLQIRDDSLAVVTARLDSTRAGIEARRDSLTVYRNDMTG